jgi:hypothetical protein
MGSRSVSSSSAASARRDNSFAWRHNSSRPIRGPTAALTSEPKSWQRDEYAEIEYAALPVVNWLSGCAATCFE